MVRRWLEEEEASLFLVPLLRTSLEAGSSVGWILSASSLPKNEVITEINVALNTNAMLVVNTSAMFDTPVTFQSLNIWSP